MKVLFQGQSPVDSERKIPSYYWRHERFPGALARRLGCLDILNGARFHVEEDVSDRAPDEAADLIVKFLEGEKEKIRSSLLSQQEKGRIKSFGSFNWGVLSWREGTADVAWREELPDGTVRERSRVYKIGKILRKAGAPPEVVRMFETRKAVTSWDVLITTDPAEVLSMSHKRSWTSCMRPGGSYQRGPMADMAQGTALVLFFEPGADEPCGRTLLRPAVLEGEPVILSPGAVLYGRGPGEEALHALFQEVADLAGIGVCTRLWTSEGGGLCDDIYCDVEREGLTQSLTEALAAWENLRRAFEPLIREARRKGLAPKRLERLQRKLGIPFSPGAPFVWSLGEAEREARGGVCHLLFEFVPPYSREEEDEEEEEEEYVLFPRGTPLELLLEEGEVSPTKRWEELYMMSPFAWMRA